MPPLPNRTVEHIRSLSLAAASLNMVSDQFSAVIDSLDASLKHLNLGLEVWVEVRPSLLLGYARIGSQWGVAIHRNDSVGNTAWLFNEAPRRLRIEAIDSLLPLLNKMRSEAELFTEELRKVNNKLREVFGDDTIDAVIAPTPAAPKAKS